MRIGGSTPRLPRIRVFEKARAGVYLGLNALEQTLKERSTLILDQRTPPFNLLTAKPEAPAKK
jgi:hypothetical protein